MADRNSKSLQSLADLAGILSESVNLEQLLSDQSSLTFSGVWGSVRGLLAAALAQKNLNLLMILPQAADADIVAGDAMAFGLTESYALP